MRIGLYVDVARDERPTGIGKHVLYLIDALARLDRDNEYLLYYPTPAFAPEQGFPHAPRQDNFRARPVRFPRDWHSIRPRAWWNWYLPWVLRRDRVDVFHGPNHFLPRFDSRRNVVTIHDVAYFKMEVHGATLDAVMREWTRHALSNAGRVIALSENTRRDVLELGMAPENVKVIYGGGNIVPEDRIAFSRLPEMRSSLDLPAKYILFIGALQPRKNVPFLVRAYAELRRRYGTDHELVLAGPKDGATGEILALCKELGVTDHVRLTGYLEDWQIPLLYKEAGLFVLPTRYEGFTLVTLEAMAYGTPLIATDSSSIREGVGDAGLLVPVDDVGRLAADMHSTLHDPLLRQQLIERGKVQSRKFTWQRCAEETLALYREIAIAPMPLELPT